MVPSWLDYKPGANLAETAWPVIHQEGQKVFRWAVYEIAKVGKEIIADAGLTPDQIAAFIPHQANERIIDSLAKSMELPESVAIARDIRTTHLSPLLWTLCLQSTQNYMARTHYS